jgi:hypothetical protein
MCYKLQDKVVTVSHKQFYKYCYALSQSNKIFEQNKKLFFLSKSNY